MTILDSPSPNQGARPAGVKPTVIVIHGTAGTDASDLAWCRDPRSQISYHYLLLRDGAIHRLVHPTRRAWHAGKSRWRGKADVNDFGIGIGLSNTGSGVPFTDPQYRSAAWLCAVLMQHYPVPMQNIVGHHNISGAHLKVRPDPKTDPWEWFEWGRFFAELLEAR